MNFGEAIEAAKEGKKIAREGWNGKGMFVCFMPSMKIPAGMINGRTRHFVTDEMLQGDRNGDERIDGCLPVGGYFVMWTAQAIWQPGWLASQADMLAEDWHVVS